MNELPATAPEVTYQNGMLTIVARNSTLGDILQEVHKLTGASIDVPPNATERVATRLGPGPAQDVLASLLNGANFNYVMLGSPDNPAALSKVVLTTKTSGGSTETAYQPPPQQQAYVPQPMMAPGAGPGGPVAQQVENGEESDTADEDAEETDQDQDQAEGQAATGDGSQPNSGPKTPEQILEMLRQKQQPGGQQPGQLPRFNQNVPQMQQPQSDNE